MTCDPISALTAVAALYTLAGVALWIVVRFPRRRD
jgi:hypothetical protein